MNEQTYRQAIIYWHTSDRRITIERTFALGDLILLGVANMGIKESRAIEMIMEWAEPFAMGQTTYNRAARLARVFTKNQRKVLCDVALPLIKAEILASGKYSGKRRIHMIADIKSGKITAPWDSITGGGTRCTEIEKPLIERHRANSINAGTDEYLNPTNLKRNGEWCLDSVVNLLAHLITSVPDFDQALQEAKRRAGKA